MKVVYKLYCKDSSVDKFYIGSTKNFKKRLTVHKSRYKSLNLDVYKYIREHGGWSNWTYLFLEEYEDGFDKHLLKDREYYHIDLTWDINLNMRRPYNIGNGRKEREKIQKKIHYKKNKVEILAKCKIYRQEHKVEISTNKKIYRQEHKVKIAERKKIYRQEHKNELVEKAKIKYQQNKVEILEKRKIKIDCGFCGATVRKSDMSRHQRSKKCKLIQGNL